MWMTDEGLALIRQFEGFRGEAYRCPAGEWTIGYGHTSAAGPPDVKPGMRMSEAEARAVLARDVELFARGVRRALTREVNASQFSALVSFAFNVGEGAFRRSSVLKAVNEGRFEDVPERLMLWVKADGRRLEGLARRRRAEARLFAMPPAAPTDAPRMGLFGLLIALFRALFSRRETGR
jgi:lysozyme